MILPIKVQLKEKFKATKNNMIDWDLTTSSLLIKQNKLGNLINKTMILRLLVQMDFLLWLFTKTLITFQIVSRLFINVLIQKFKIITFQI